LYSPCFKVELEVELANNAKETTPARVRQTGKANMSLHDRHFSFAFTPDILKSPFFCRKHEFSRFYKHSKNDELYHYLIIFLIIFEEFWITLSHTFWLQFSS